MRKYRLISTDFRFMYGPYTVVLSKIRPILVGNSELVINCIEHEHPQDRGTCLKTFVSAKKKFYWQACHLVSHWADLLLGWLVSLLAGWSVSNAFAFSSFFGLFFTFLPQYSPTAGNYYCRVPGPIKRANNTKQAIKRASNQTSKQ